MFIDTPAKIAVIGAGPVGLEAALYARFLGYEVELFEQGQVAAEVRKRGDQRMPTTFAENSSSLALAALDAQDENFRPPQDSFTLTWEQWVERYLVPLAHSDLLEDGLKLETTVVSITRLATPTETNAEDGEEDEAADDEEDLTDEPAPPNFQLLVRDATGAERAVEVHAVIDASGAASSVAAWQADFALPSFRAGEGPAGLVTPIPHFYVIGSKSVGREAGFTFAAALRQIRDLFTLIGGRETLDLYASMKRPGT